MFSICEELRTAHVEYLKVAKGNKGHGLGDGSTYRFGAVLLIVVGSDIIKGVEQEYLKAALESFDVKGKPSLRLIKACKTENMHSSDTLRFKLSIPGDIRLENAMIDSPELS